MKIARHAEILKLIKEHDFETQEELVKKLNEKGFVATQATISRDIKELKLTKVATEKGTVRYMVIHGQKNGADEKYLRTLRDAVVSVDIAGNLLVVKTESGMAMAAAAALDDLDWKDIVGCIAGDNTIFLAIKTPQAAEQVMNSLKKIIGVG